MKISVIGTNYLGATTAAGLAEFGFDVVGVDIDEARVKVLGSGRAPLYEPGLDELLRKHTDSGRLRFTTDYREVADWAQVFFICVGTPQGAHGAADLSQVQAVVDTLAPLLTGPALVVGRSTVPVGTAAWIGRRFAERTGDLPGLEVAWQPEFLREAHAVEDTLHPDRLVFGVCSESAERTLREIFARPIDEGSPVIVTDRETAELVKAAANSFLAMKISYINALAGLCETVGADVSTLADALGHDKRIGRGSLSAGPGYGGGCLPKDLHAFTARAEELGSTELGGLLRQVDLINSARQARIVGVLAEALEGGLEGKAIAVLGAAFKAETDDIRESPALSVAELIRARGAAVTLFDPQAMENARRAFPLITYADSAVDACVGAHAVVHLTDWPQFRELDPRALREVVANPVLIDARLSLDLDAWSEAGWACHPRTAKA
ncbi:UDP-glucose/GDP-mannose dehydrogenase family protein [Actinospica durhamensis]|uniref:UDP-glucose 6-dehydrogenase n=1 Tax=Actinospica durhamensis TaxID=1508375 RepID=A0A941IPB2_9ACTN|nr:UDP-glucose/GDP-mannose dehydrogenase family protein [Actinospica durhamensis]